MDLVPFWHMSSVEKWLHSLIACLDLRGKVPIYLYSWVGRNNSNVGALLNSLHNFGRKSFHPWDSEFTRMLNVIIWPFPRGFAALPVISSPTFKCLHRYPSYIYRVRGLRATCQIPRSKVALTRHIPQKLSKNQKNKDNKLRLSNT